MATAVGDGFQGWSYLVRGLQTLLIGLIYRWGLNCLSALAGSLFSLLAFNCLTCAITGLLCALLSWRL